jgi:toxin ParE1/3/4
MRTTIWSDAALQDFAAIDDWYADRNVEFANRVAIAAVQAARRLAEYPQIGEDIGNGMRKWAVTGSDYRLIYRVDANAIQILRIRHAREDWRL